GHVLVDLHCRAGAALDREALAGRRRARGADVRVAGAGAAVCTGDAGFVAIAPDTAAHTLVDSHCHLGDAAFDADRDAVLARARAAGVSHVVAIGESVTGSERAATLARGTRGVSATAGVHPHEASSWSAETAGRMRALRAVASSPPVVVLHSFASGDAVWGAGMAINAYFSFSGMITFKNWTMTDRLSACPPDRLLVETDAPYLAPVPHRGKRNEPGFVRDIAERAAVLRGESFDELTRRTTENARRCFGSRIDSSL